MTVPLLTRRAGLAAAAALPLGLAAPLLAQARRKVTLVYAIQVIDSTADGFFASIPIGAGFYAQEGLDVEIQTVAGSSAAVNLLANGRAQFTTHGTAGLFTGVDKGVPMKGFICQIPDYFISIAVDRAGPIQTFDQLKGKTIGVPAMAGSPMIVTKSVMSAHGWDPDKDVQFLAVGTGLPALDALRRGRVEALVAFDAPFALFEFNGGDFRYFRPPPMSTLGFAHTTNTLVSTLEKEPEMVAGLGRAMAKAIVYMAAAPSEELTKLHFKVFPATRPTGLSDDQVTRLDALRLKARLAFMRIQKRVFDRTERLGDATDAEVEGQRDLLKLGNEIQNPQPASAYFTRQFVDAFNQIDIPRLIEEAKAFRA